MRRKCLGPPGATGQLPSGAPHEDKTLLIELSRLSRFAAASRQRRGERSLETFSFLRFIHCCGADPRRPVHREAQDRRETPDAQADGVAPGSMAVHVRATGPRSTGGSPPFSAGAMVTMAGRTIIQRSRASTAKCVGLGCAI